MRCQSKCEDTFDRYPHEAHGIVGLISCSKVKNGTRQRARDLYSKSRLFRAFLRTCESSYPSVLILSAKHGIIEPDEVIDPYDVSLADLSADEQREWAEKVNRQLAELKYVDRFVCFAGDLYSDLLDDPRVRRATWEYDLKQEHAPRRRPRGCGDVFSRVSACLRSLGIS